MGVLSEKRYRCNTLEQDRGRGENPERPEPWTMGGA